MLTEDHSSEGTQILKEVQEERHILAFEKADTRCIKSSLLGKMSKAVRNTRVVAAA